MDAVWWVLIISTVSTLIGMSWACCMVLIHCVVTLILSYWAAKVAAKPLLEEARAIRRKIEKGLRALGVGKDVIKSLAGRKGGSVRPDPVGDWLGEKVPFLKGIFNRGSSKPDNNRALEIIAEVKKKYGLKDEKGPEPNEGVVMVGGQ